MVKLFTSEDCPPCKLEKIFLEKKGIEYEEIDLDTKRGQKYAKKYDISAVPALKKGDKILVGFSPKKVKRFLRE